MGKRGPQPKPQWYRDLVGNPGRRQTVQILPDKIVPEIPAPPRYDAEQRAVWTEVTGVLSQVQALSLGDQLVLHRYVELLVVYRRAEAWMKEQGNGNIVYPIKDKNGTVKSIRMLPQLKVMLEISGHLLRIEQHFGLTPASRVHVGLTGGSATVSTDHDPFA